MPGFGGDEGDKKTDLPGTVNSAGEKPSFEEWRKQKRRAKGKGTSVYEQMKNSRFGAVRIIYKIIHSTGLIFMAIGSFIAWLIGFFLI